MNEDLNVYELDTDDFMTAVESALTEGGYDVREQVPAGIWWFKTDKGEGEAAAEIGEVFRQLVAARLRAVAQ